MTPPDYDDLCARLRDNADYSTSFAPQYREKHIDWLAADAIEALREKVADLKAGHVARDKATAEYGTMLEKAEADNAALRQLVQSISYRLNGGYDAITKGIATDCDAAMREGKGGK